VPQRPQSAHRTLDFLESSSELETLNAIRKLEPELIFVVGWTLMTVAMMLPTSMPLVTLFRRLTRQRSDRLQLVVLLVVGYLGVWTLFGALAHFGDFFVHEAVERSAWLETNAWVIGAGTIMLAGLYQFSSLKYACLTVCRSPVAFVMQSWRGSARRDAFRLGLHHGLVCAGCCWALMLLMFAVGIGSIVWMLALSAVIATEKNASWGRRLSSPLGALLIAGGVVLAFAGALEQLERPVALGRQAATASLTGVRGDSELFTFLRYDLSRVSIETLPRST
jgi:predicted metal-binding membrane protein